LETKLRLLSATFAMCHCGSPPSLRMALMLAVTWCVAENRFSRLAAHCAGGDCVTDMSHC
jgi:hypothetical protein